MCFRAKGNRRVEINHNPWRLKAKAREPLLSEEGVTHRKKRCAEPEPVFSHIRYDGGYLRFRHFGQDKVEMDFAALAIALNLSKLARKLASQAKNPEKPACNRQLLLIIRVFQVSFIKTEAISADIGAAAKLAA